MPDYPICAQCGNQLPPTPCPHCLLGLALLPPDTDTKTTAQVPVSSVMTGRTQLPWLFGDYDLLEEIGRGGMGIVYRGRQLSLNRPIAVKMIKGGQLAEENQVRRFQTEAEAAARLQHPNIVAIHEVGQHQSHYFFSMDYVLGLSLAHTVRREGRLPAKTAARYVRLCAEAIYYAHQHGVLHRDITPSNILIDETDQPKVTDFGLAKLTERGTERTESGVLIGAIGYLSPEHASGNTSKIVARSDVFSLGAVLYYSLCGQPPFPAESIWEAAQKALTVDPVQPRERHPEIPLDLNTICLKCLEKEPNARYESAKALADDLASFLRDDPVLARPLGIPGKAWRWCRRRPLVAPLLAGLAILLLTVAFVTFWVFRAERRAGNAMATARQAQTEAGRAKEEVHLRDFVSDSQYTRRSLQMSGWSLRIAAAASNAPKSRAEAEVRNHAAAALIGIDAILHTNWSGFESVEVAASPPGSKVLTLGRISSNEAAERGFLNLFDWDTGHIDSFPLRGTGSVALLSNAIPLQLVPDPTNKLRYHVWDLARSEIWRDFLIVPTTEADSRGLSKQRACRRISPDGTLVAVAHPFSGSNGTMCVWETVSGRQIVRSELSYAWAINNLMFSPDNTLLAAGDDNGGITLWSLDSGRQWRAFRDNGAQIQSLVFHRDVRTEETRTNSSNWLLAAGDSGGVVAVWDLSTIRPRIRFVADDAQLVAFSPDGMTLASGGSQQLQLWDVATGRPLLNMPAGESQEGLAFSPDGRKLIAASNRSEGGASLLLWNLEDGRGVRTLRGLRSRVSMVSFSADQQKLAAFSRSHEVAIWDLAASRLLRVLVVPHGVVENEVALAFSLDGRELSVASERSVKRWKVDTGEVLSEIKIRPGLGNSIAYTRSNSLLLFRLETMASGVVPYAIASPADFPRVIRMYDLLGPNPKQHVLEITNFNYGANSIKTCSDGQYFIVDGIEVSGGRTNRVLACIDGPERKMRWSRQLGSGHSRGEELRIDPAGEILVVTDDSGNVGTQFDLKSGAPLLSYTEMYPVALGPHGSNWVAWNQKDARGILLFVGQATSPLVTLGMDGAVEKTLPAFSPTGDMIGWGQADGSVLLFELPELSNRLTTLGLGW